MLERKFHKPWLGVLLIAAAALVAYWPALGGKFLWDDESLVAKNRLVHDANGLYRIWCTTDAIDYWPVTNTVFWLEWRLWGTSTISYHAVNLTLHIANSLLIWLILRRLSIPSAFLAGLLFAVHPVNVESVAWIAQLKNVLAMFFMLVSVWCYLHHKAADGIGGEVERIIHSQINRGYHLRLDNGNHWYWLSVFVFALAMLSKGSVAILPMILSLIDGWQYRQIKSATCCEPRHFGWSPFRSLPSTFGFKRTARMRASARPVLPNDWPARVLPPGSTFPNRSPRSG